MPRPYVACLALLIPTAAAAAGFDTRAVGTFGSQRGSYEQEIVVKPDGAGGYIGAFSTATGTGCGGGVTGPGQVTGPRRIVFTKQDDRTCRITADYTPDFRSVAVTEDGCIAWHGASCDFEGKMRRTRR